MASAVLAYDGIVMVGVALDGVAAMNKGAGDESRSVEGADQHQVPSEEGSD